MTRLDRLSALLAGLAPKIEVAPATADDGDGQFLLLHLLLEGSYRDGLAAETGEPLAAPGLVVRRGDRRRLRDAAAPAGPPGGLVLRVRFDGPAAALLLSAFARPLLIELGSQLGELDLVVRLIAAELAEPRCGQPALLERAGEILLIGVLRHLLASPRSGRGMMNGLADPRLARAIVAIHRQPRAPWSLAGLAAEAGMSRTAFAIRFRELIGCPPGSYLTDLRLAIARREIERGASLKRAAGEAGYASTTALSRALARRSGRAESAPAD